jgi:hypothetical protein
MEKHLEAESLLSYPAQARNTKGQARGGPSNPIPVAFA